MLRQERSLAAIATVCNAGGNIKNEAGSLLTFKHFAPYPKEEEYVATEADMKRMFKVKG